MKDREIEDIFKISSSTLHDWLNKPNHNRRVLALFLKSLDLANIKEDKRYVTVQEAARIVKCSEALIFKFLKEEKIKKYLLGKRNILLDYYEVLSLVKEVKQ